MSLVLPISPVDQLASAPPAAEVIVSVLASDSLLARLAAEGLRPVLADVDPALGGLSRASVEECIGVETRRVVLDEDHGAWAADRALAQSTAPRGIAVDTPASAPAAWVPIAPGLRGWGPDLVEVDERVLAGGAVAVLEFLGVAGVQAQAYDRDLAFARPGSPLRGRRRDYPGAEAWRRKMLCVPAWEQVWASLEAATAELSRQLSFDFAASAPRRSSVPAWGLRRAESA